MLQKDAQYDDDCVVVVVESSKYQKWRIIYYINFLFEHFGSSSKYQKIRRETIPKRLLVKMLQKQNVFGVFSIFRCFMKL